MNYEKFVKEVKRGVEDIVEKELGEGVVVVRNVLKNNNVRRKAISIVRIVMVFYLNDVKTKMKFNDKVP